METGDCDGRYPFSGLDTGPLAVLDCDAYSYPYAAFRQAWENSDLADTVACFFTDAQKQSVIRNTHWRSFGADATTKVDDLRERRKIYNFYLRRYVMPEFREYVQPYRVSSITSYLRDMMLYWGCILRRR